MGQKEQTLAGLVDAIVEASDRDRVSLGDLIDAVGQASFTPVLLMPALAIATPLSGIPLFSTLMGALIFLVSVQMILRLDRLWLPSWLLRRSADGARIAAAFTYARPAMVWLDRHTRERATVLLHRPLIFFPQGLCILSGLIMPFLEFVPFTSSLVGISVALLAFGMLARDGLYLILGTLPYLAVVLLTLRLVSGG